MAKESSSFLRPPLICTDLSIPKIWLVWSVRFLKTNLGLFLKKFSAKLKVLAETNLGFLEEIVLHCIKKFGWRQERILYKTRGS